MRNRKITTILALLLFAVLQGVYAQTERDTLQRELAIALRQIAAEKMKLQRQEALIKRQQEQLQWEEDKLNRQLDSQLDSQLANLSIQDQHSDLRQRLAAETQRFFVSLRMRQMELDKREYEIRQQQETLERREAFIKKQLEVLEKQ